MSAQDRLAAIRAGLDAGKSLRAIARDLGVSDETVRDALRTPHSAPAYPPPAAEYAPADRVRGYVPPGPLRVLPPTTDEQRLTQGGAVDPDKSFIRCTCGAPAWRVAPGVDEWECAVPPGPRSPHPPRQIADSSGTPQLVWAPFRIKPFPGAT